ncbi:MAG: 4'-phosphopantetheinyl transferase superfamily protein [Pseudomonadales bacterium]
MVSAGGLDDNSDMDAEQINQAIAAAFSAIDDCRLLAGDIVDCVDALYPEEQVAVAQAIGRRQREFATGRTLARRLMGELGIAPAAIPRGAQRQPVWPAGVVGSLTHAERVAVAALATSAKCRALGIDIEIADRVGPELYPKLFRPAELSAIDGDRRLAGLMFSAKEAGYKATCALAPRFVAFRDAEIDIDQEQQRFGFRYLGDHTPSAVMEEGSGRYLFCGPYVLSLFIIR